MTINTKKILLISAIFFTFNAFANSNSIVAIVNDDIITLGFISKNQKKDTNKEQKMQLINTQIDTLLQLQKIKEINISPTNQAINKTINIIAAKNNTTIEKLQSLPEFAQIKKQVTTHLSLIKLKEFALKDTVIDLSKQEIKQLIENTKKTSSKQIKIAQISIISIKKKDPLKTKDQEIKDFLSNLKNKIDNGADFATLAKLHSQDTSYQNGGKSDWLYIDKLSNTLKKQIAQLQENKTSKPFKSNQGWHIIKIIAAREINNSIALAKSKLLQIKRDNAYKKWINNLRKGAYIKINKHKL